MPVFRPQNRWMSRISLVRGADRNRDLSRFIKDMHEKKEACHDRHAPNENNDYANNFDRTAIAAVVNKRAPLLSAFQSRSRPISPAAAIACAPSKRCRKGSYPPIVHPLRHGAQIGRSVIRPSPLSGMGTFYLLAEMPVLNSQKQACHLIARLPLKMELPFDFN
jgi:hypothetical protein